MKWFIRCRGCLSVMALQAEAPRYDLKCAACGEGVEVMGAVRQQRLVRIEERTPCDDRCCFASGPDCNCQCGGQNHGSRIVVSVVIDLGGIPKVSPISPEKAKRVFAEWKKAEQAVLARIHKHYPSAAEFRKGNAVGMSEWEIVQGQRGYRFLDKVVLAGKLKTHHGRLKALAELDKKLTEAAR